MKLLFVKVCCISFSILVLTVNIFFLRLLGQFTPSTTLFHGMRAAAAAVFLSHWKLKFLKSPAAWPPGNPNGSSHLSLHFLFLLFMSLFCYSG